MDQGLIEFPQNSRESSPSAPAIKIPNETPLVSSFVRDIWFNNRDVIGISTGIRYKYYAQRQDAENYQLRYEPD